MQATRRRLCAALVAIGCAFGAAACGDDDGEPAATPAAAQQPADDLQPVKDFAQEVKVKRPQRKVRTRSAEQAETGPEVARV